MITGPMRPTEIAQRMGLAVATFMKRRHQYEKCDGMPGAITRTGKVTYDRAGMEAWLTRHDPRRPKGHANDAIAPPMPNTDNEWNRFLHQHYGQPAL